MIITMFRNVFKYYIYKITKSIINLLLLSLLDEFFVSDHLPKLKLEKDYHSLKYKNY